MRGEDQSCDEKPIMSRSVCKYWLRIRESSASRASPEWSGHWCSVHKRHIGLAQSQVKTLKKTVRTYQCCLYADRFGRFESDTKVSFLIVRIKRFVRDSVLKIGVKDRTEGQSVVPRTAEVSDVDVLIARCLALTPLQQCVPFRTVASEHQLWQRVGLVLITTE